MPPLEGVGPFADAVESTENMAQLEALLVQIGQNLGFRHHLLSVHPAGAERPLILTDIPAGRAFSTGAVQAVAARRIRPFFWELQAGKPQSRRAGASIFVIPMHIPGIATGFLCWFLADGEISRNSLGVGQYLAGCLFEQAYRLGAGVARKPGKLSRRQRDCLRLAARGKSDWVASQILGLQPDTVHKYIEQAKARYNVSTRTELVVRALYDGELHFSDLIDQESASAGG